MRRPVHCHTFATQPLKVFKRLGGMPCRALRDEQIIPNCLLHYRDSKVASTGHGNNYSCFSWAGGARDVSLWPGGAHGVSYLPQETISCLLNA